MMSYDFVVRNCVGTDKYESCIEISGPQGVERFCFGYIVDKFSWPMFFNNDGVLFGAAEATSDPFFFALVYGLGGWQGPFTGGNGTHWVSSNKAMMSLGWTEYPFPEESNGFGQCKLTALDLDSSGVASALIEYEWEGGTSHSVHKKWATRV
ncbi:hypothetical protein [Desulfoluna butyratoxydans]|nr:hypothetical protein [Desulfoluna butyratoxydans]